MEKSSIELSFGGKLKNSDNHTLSGEIKSPSDISTSDLSTGVNLLLTFIKNTVDFEIGGYRIAENEILNHTAVSQNIGLDRSKDVDVKIIKIKTGTQIFLVLLHSTFSEVPSFIIHFLSIIESQNDGDYYEGDFMILNQCDFKSNPGGILKIGEKTIEALENGGKGLNFEGKSKAVIRV